MCLKSKFDADKVLEQYGYKVGGLLAVAKGGFNEAYDEAAANDFKDSILREDSKARVNAVYDAIIAAYGDIDLERFANPLAVYGAATVIGAINDTISSLENYATATPEEFSLAADAFAKKVKTDKRAEQKLRSRGVTI